MTALLNKKQVGELLGVSERTLDRWRERVGGVVRFRQRDVEELVALHVLLRYVEGRTDWAANNRGKLKMETGR